MDCEATFILGQILLGLTSHTSIFKLLSLNFMYNGDITSSTTSSGCKEGMTITYVTFLVDPDVR